MPLTANDLKACKRFSIVKPLKACWNIARAAEWSSSNFSEKSKN